MIKKLSFIVFICISLNVNIVFAGNTYNAYNLLPVIDNISNQEFNEILKKQLNTMQQNTTIMPFEKDNSLYAEGFMIYKANTLNGLHISIYRKDSSIYRVSMIFPQINNWAKNDSFIILNTVFDLIGLDNDEKASLLKLNKDNASQVWCKKSSRFYHLLLMKDDDLILIGIMAHR